MGVFDYIIGRDKLKYDLAKANSEIEAKDNTITSTSEKLVEANSYNGVYKPLFSISYDGEKNTGELGAITRYTLDYAGLRYRSWQSYLDDEVTQTVVKKFVTWIIGKGLKLQSEPVDSVLGLTGVQSTTFSKTVEDKFKLYRKSRISDYSGMSNLNQISKTAYINAIIGGDVLVILRVVNGNLNVQLVDGSNLITPLFDDHNAKALARGNTIKNGIEENKKGEHIAFYVRNKNNDIQRILARGKKTGKETAFIVYGMRYRIDDNRGIPLISTVLETLKKLDRYKEAAVGSAEERAKIVMQVTHQEHSTGENPILKNVATAYNTDSSQDIAVDVNGNQLADKIAVSTNKQTFNMPNGAKLEALDSKSEINFDGFYSPNVNMICATIGIPPEVALSKYDSNFSASRAALKDWEHTIDVERDYFSLQFDQRIYNAWLEMEVMTSKINAPGYINAVVKKDVMSLEAFRNARFTGANVPHIDPVKEVEAERLKLGKSGASIPLTTAEAATEALNGGDSDSNFKKYAEELKETISLEIVEPVKEVVKESNNKIDDKDADK